MKGQSLCRPRIYVDHDQTSNHHPHTEIKIASVFRNLRDKNNIQ